MPVVRRPAHRRAVRGPRRLLLLLLAALLVLGQTVLLTGGAAAEDPAELTIDKQVLGWTDGQEVQPGETFTYTLTITCSNIGSGGCTSAQLTDQLPPWLTVTGPVTVTGAAGSATVVGPDVTVTFTDPLTDPVGGSGLLDQSTATVTIPVRVADDIPAAQDGQNLVNTASVGATNAVTATDTFTVVPDVPVVLEATAAKSYAPSSAVAAPGTPTTLTLTGGHASNVPVDRIVLTDPLDPTADPNPFDQLGLTGDLTESLPEGADTVQVDVWVDGAWVTGTPGAAAALPAGVDPAEVRGIRVTFVDTDGATIPPDASGSIAVDLVQRDTTAGIDDLTIDNELTVLAGAGATESPAATADDQYVIGSADLPLAATKTFAPDLIPVGGSSTVSLGATNTSTRVLDSLTITEPGAGQANPFTEGLSFDGWGAVQWPAGATGATVVWTLLDGSTVTAVAAGPNTLPDPPADVVGFAVTFTGPVVAGAEAAIAFDVIAATEQAVEELTHTNVIDAASTAPGGFTGTALAQDDLTVLQERLAVSVDKSISPAEILSVPGEPATVQLTGTVEDFPASTTDAHQLVVTDPADLTTDTWWDAFEARAVAATPIPAEATLTVQYWDGNQWIDVPGMVGLAGPQVFSGALPPEVVANAQGLRFVYDSDAGFAPGTQVKPNISFALRPDLAGSDLEIENCAAADASADAIVADRAVQDPCPTIQLVPPTPGTGDLIEKDWDAPKLIGERTGDDAGLTLRWSTGGQSFLDRVVLTDVPDPSAIMLPTTVFDFFDLVRVDPITAAQDPVLVWDRIASVELFRTGQGWVRAAADPCPAACDGTFPGVTLSAAERADTLSFRLTLEESPTRGARSGQDPTAPPVGSGVARSTGNTRTVHPVFRIRDELRSDPTVPVTADQVQNLPGRTGEVSNTARADAYVGDDIVVSDSASDIIAIAGVPVTVDVSKDWTGGPLGLPPAGTAPADRPSGIVSVVAVNTTPRRIDELVVTEAIDGTTPFDAFDLTGFSALTDPAAIGADNVTVAVLLADGSMLTLDRAGALAATTDDLADAVGFTVTYVGRILEGARAEIRFATRLRENTRSGPPVTPGLTVDNTVGVVGSDLVGYPGVDPLTHSDSASDDIDVIAPGIDVAATKEFELDAQTEPDRDPLALTLAATPAGPSRTNRMEIEEADPRFWNQYAFVGFGDFALTAPIEQVRVDARVGGTFTAGGGTLDYTGGNWVVGTAAAAPALPTGISPDQVQGLRFVYTKADNSIWENPSTPAQPVELSVQRRLELASGGPVLTDLAGNDPAPGETEAGLATNEIAATVVGPDLVAGEQITASTTADDFIRYEHMLNAVVVTKSPSGAQSPSAAVPYQLSFTNTGDAPIVDPVITDRIPSDASGPLLRLDPDLPPGSSPYNFELTGDAPTEPNGLPLPQTVSEVTVTSTADQLTFTFPTGSVLEPGQTYRIGVALLFRAGLPGNTPVTNTTGIVGDRPWDTCTSQLDDTTGECRAETTVYPVLAGALRGVKKVRSVDQELGVLDTRGVPGGCVADADGFHVGGCVPVTKPGGDEVWRMTFTNTGNLPMDRVFAIDRLPTPGDTGAIVALPRDSTWRPIVKDVALVGTTSGAVSGFRTFYTSDPDLCTDDLILGGNCQPSDWLPWTTAVDPAQVVALKFEIDLFEEFLAPLGAVTIDLTTTTPAVSPTSGADTIAWNTTAAAGRTNDGGTLGIAPRSEGNKVGVALATGPLQVLKEVTGPASEFAPASFALQVECTSVGQVVDLGDDGSLTAVEGEVSGILNLPWGSTCTVADDRESSGATDFGSTTVTVQRDPQTVPVVIATNTYADASLTLTKAIDSAAVDADGVPVGYGPFEFAVSCTFLGSPVLAAGFDTDPMSVTLEAGSSTTLTELPAGSSCAVTETDDRDALATALVVSPDTEPVDGDVATVGLTAEDTVVVTATNSYGTGGLAISKTVDGPAAELVGAGPFTVAVSCVLDDASGSRNVWDGTVVVGGDLPLLTTVDDIAAGAECSVTEPGDGGATTTLVTPGTTVIGLDQVATVGITNTFEVGAIRVDKTVSGDGAGYGTGPFRVELSCTFEGVAFNIPGGAARVIVPGTPVVYDELPVGATCTLAEVVSGGATSVSIDGAAGPTVTVTVTQETLQLALDNSFDVGEIRVLKRLAGPGAGAHQGDTFTFRLACTWVVDGSTVPVPLPTDSAVASAATDWLAVFSGVPYGSLCEITEVGAADADRIVVTVDGRTSELDPGEAAAGDAWRDLEAATATCLTVEFVNVWGDATVVPLPPTELAEISGCVEVSPTTSTPAPTPAPGPGPGAGPWLPNTGVPVGSMLTWALLLLTGGLGLALLTRRTRTGSRVG